MGQRSTGKVNLATQPRAVGLLGGEQRCLSDSATVSLRVHSPGAGPGETSQPTSRKSSDLSRGVGAGGRASSGPPERQARECWCVGMEARWLCLKTCGVLGCLGGRLRLKILGIAASPSAQQPGKRWRVRHGKAVLGAEQSLSESGPDPQLQEVQSDPGQ